VTQCNEAVLIVSSVVDGSFLQWRQQLSPLEQFVEELKVISPLLLLLASPLLLMLADPLLHLLFHTADSSSSDQSIRSDHDCDLRLTIAIFMSCQFIPGRV